MDVFVKGVSFNNKGAELMMYSIRDRVRQWNATNKVAINFQIGTCEQRNKTGVHHDLHHYLWKRFRKTPYVVDTFNAVSRAIPVSLRDRYKLVLEPDIDCVMDASGFGYSDQWGEKRTQNTAQLCQYWKKKREKSNFFTSSFWSFQQ